MTTPHVFLGGDVDLYLRHCAGAERAVVLVALSLLDPRGRVTVAEAVSALIGSPGGAVGKDFLGYLQGPGLHSTVQRGLAHLLADRVVRAVDGVHFDQDHVRRRRLVAGLHRPTSSLCPGPGTPPPE